MNPCNFDSCGGFLCQLVKLCIPNCYLTEICRITKGTATG
nr:MAG TPA: hypothetical protein [Caudoviricetes sp.]